MDIIDHSFSYVFLYFNIIDQVWDFKVIFSDKDFDIYRFYNSYKVFVPVIMKDLLRNNYNIFLMDHFYNLIDVYLLRSVINVVQ